MSRTPTHVTSGGTNSLLLLATPGTLLPGSVFTNSTGADVRMALFDSTTAPTLAASGAPYAQPSGVALWSDRIPSGGTWTPAPGAHGISFTNGVYMVAFPYVAIAGENRPGVVNPTGVNQPSYTALASANVAVDAWVQGAA